ncbi:MAG TPA: DUF1566 domain-containing protein [Syntrophales bacterium]|nr:DUF1566 domain-containing protein [Syntrophales bacterium]
MCKKVLSLALIMFLTLFPLTLLHAGEFYKWTDSEGTVHYSDSPIDTPETSAEQEQKIVGPELTPREGTSGFKESPTDYMPQLPSDWIKTAVPPKEAKALESLLKSRFMAHVNFLKRGDIETAVTYYTPSLREKAGRELYPLKGLLWETPPEEWASLVSFSLVNVYVSKGSSSALCRITKAGNEYPLFVIFTKEKDGQWYLSSPPDMGISSATFAGYCHNNWLALSQTMETQNVAASMTFYLNGERHFSMRQGKEPAIDVYDLNDTLLIKGSPADKIEQIRAMVWFSPFTFIVPNAVLYQAVPKGPCSVSGKIPFSVSFSGENRIGPGRDDGNLKKAEGIVERVSQDEIAYQFKCDVDPAPKDGTTVVYKGTLKLSLEPFLKDDINVKGYTLVGHTRPFPVVGSSELPVTTLGDVRYTLFQKTKAAKPSHDERFIAYDNGTILDTNTNLMWAAKDNGSNINWQDAKSYCDNYSGGGYTDWRMPTQDELAGLYDAKKRYKTACGYYAYLTELTGLTCSFVWAAETRGSDGAYFYFGNGSRNWTRHSDDNYNRALPVRAVK